MICTATMFIAFFFYHSFLSRPDVKKAVIAGLALGVSLISKYTALLLLPSFLAVLLLDVFVFRKNETDWKRLAVLHILWLLVAFIVVGASYNFSFNYGLFFEGMTKLYPFNPDRYNYIFGAASKDPFWYYCLAAFLIKTPLSFLLLFLLAIIGSVISRHNMRDNSL